MTKGRKARKVNTAIDQTIYSHLNFKVRFKNSYLDKNMWPEKYKYKIAAVPMNLKYREFDRINQKNFYKIKKDKAKYLENAFLKTCKSAIEAKCKIIAYNEMSYPIVCHSSLSPELSELCNKEKCFIIAGSYHEVRTKEKDYKFSKSLIFNYSNQGPVEQYKNSRGKFHGELEDIECPTECSFNIIHSRYGTFIPVICSDIDDRNLEDNLRVMNANSINNVHSHPIDLIIIPSYTSEPYEIVRYSKRVSAYTFCNVLFVNNIASDESPKLFRNGKEIPYTNLINSSGFPDVYIFQIDLIESRTERLNSCNAIDLIG